MPTPIAAVWVRAGCQQPFDALNIALIQQMRKLPGLKLPLIVVSDYQQHGADKKGEQEPN